MAGWSTFWIGEWVENMMGSGPTALCSRPVGREHDAVGADFQDGVDQRRRAEVARGGEVEVLLQVRAELFLRRVARRHFGPGIAIIDAPDAVGQPFAEMPEDDLQARMAIE